MKGPPDLADEDHVSTEPAEQVTAPDGQVEYTVARQHSHNA